MMSSPDLGCQTTYVLWHLPNSFVVQSMSSVDDARIVVTRLLDDDVPCTDLLLQTAEPHDDIGQQWCGPQLCALVGCRCPLNREPPWSRDETSEPTVGWTSDHTPEEKRQQ